MDIAVLIRGVADPKWPLPQDLSLAALQVHGAQRGILSPFDEAALEVALALRDAGPAVRITALVAADEALTRRVAGWRPDAVHRLDLAAVAQWDGDSVAHALTQALAQLAPGAELVLIGREFGDFDDGAVPAALARQSGLPDLPLALRVQQEGDGLILLRQGSGGLERGRLAGRALLCITNDPGNRLRHPLMKNVMNARKMPLPAWHAPATAAEQVLLLDGLHPPRTVPRNGSCTWLEGSARQKAQALARALVEAARA